MQDDELYQWLHHFLLDTKQLLQAQENGAVEPYVIYRLQGRIQLLDALLDQQFAKRLSDYTKKELEPKRE